MKYKLFLVLSSLFLLLSCADEGPYKTGRIESDIKLRMVTPNEAVIYITIPQNNDNLLKIYDYTTAYLTTKPISDPKEYWYQEFYARGSWLEMDNQKIFF